MVKTIGVFALTFQKIEDLVFRLAILPDVLTGANRSQSIGNRGASVAQACQKTGLYPRPIHTPLEGVHGEGCGAVPSRAPRKAEAATLPMNLKIGLLIINDLHKHGFKGSMREIWFRGTLPMNLTAEKASSRLTQVGNASSPLPSPPEEEREKTPALRRFRGSKRERTVRGILSGLDLPRVPTPRVARSSQPWAGGLNPFGIGKCV